MGLRIYLTGESIVGGLAGRYIDILELAWIEEARPALQRTILIESALYNRKDFLNAKIRDARSISRAKRDDQLREGRRKRTERK